MKDSDAIWISLAFAVLVAGLSGLLAVSTSQEVRVLRRDFTNHAKTTVSTLENLTAIAEQQAAWQAAVNARLAEHGEPPIVVEVQK